MILGAGFGGVEAARTLARSQVEVVVVDQHNYHCFQPLLYHVATAALSPADIAWPIRSILRRQGNARVVMGRVTGIDKARKLVATDAGSFHYDFLILATGATHSYFGHDEWEKVAPGLKEIADLDGGRGENVDTRDRMRCARRQHRKRAHRGRDLDLGRRRGRLAGGGVAGHRP